MSEPLPRRVPWLTLIAVAMGFLESAVVVYLRLLYYPEGFRFPIVIIPEHVAVVELVRELTTMLIILGVAVLAGRDRHDRFFVFGFVFGVWDLVYYLGLWHFLGWPNSLTTWDVLFLIPVPWLGPVIYPIVIALLLVTGFVVHDALRKHGRRLLLNRFEWSVACVGAVVTVVAFCWNWRAVSLEIVPASFPIGIFSLGLLVGVAPFVRAAIRV